MTFIPTQTVQNAFEVCGGYLSCLGRETSRNSLPGSSLLDIADWEAYGGAAEHDAKAVAQFSRTALWRFRFESNWR